MQQILGKIRVGPYNSLAERVENITQHLWMNRYTNELSEDVTKMQGRWSENDNKILENFITDVGRTHPQARSVRMMTSPLVTEAAMVIACVSVNVRLKIR